VGIFSSIGNAIASNPQLVGTAIDAGTAAYGAYSSAQSAQEAADTVGAANERAAAQRRQAAEDARRAYQEAAQRGISALRGGYEQQREYIDPTIGPAPGELSPSQEIAMQDTRDDLREQLSASGLRGSGRATARVYGDTMGRQRARFYDQNLQNYTEGRRALGSTYASEGADVANIETGTGARGASTYSAAGRDVAGMTQQTGQEQAAAGYAGDQAVQRGIGQLGSIIADEVARSSKSNQRDAYGGY
jgi:hypothetical protein